MIDQPSSTDDENRRKAAELYALARRLEAENDYAGARENYEESLRLHEDEAVEAALRKLLATIGPL